MTAERVDLEKMRNDMAGERDRERALVVQPRPEPSAVVLWGTNDPRAMTQRMSDVADAIRDVILQRNLFTDIQGKRYVNIEGWSMTGAMIGAFPQAREVVAIEHGHLAELRVEKQGRNGPYEKVYPAFDGVIAYQATVDLVTRDGGQVGGATAMCSRREEQWRDRDDNQIASMAQTRAAAKAYRMTFGFIMPMAGYAPTPAEEMHGIEPSQNVPTRSTTGEPLDGSAGPPKCPKHPNRAMKEWGRGSASPHWKCTAVMAHGYCTQTAPMKIEASAPAAAGGEKRNGVTEPAQVESLNEFLQWARWHYALSVDDLCVALGAEKVGDLRATIDGMRGPDEAQGFDAAMRMIRKVQGDDGERRPVESTVAEADGDGGDDGDGLDGLPF